MKNKFTLEELNEMMEDNGGSLDLENCTQITALPEGLTVGGYLDLRGTQITALPEGLTVGGYLDLDNCTQIKNDDKYHRLREGDFVDGKYIYCDGMLTHISRKKVFGQYTYFVGKIKGRDAIYDGEFYAHCKSFEDGVRDLSFKRAKDRGQDQYKDLTLDSVVKHDDAIVMYRIITGACQAGTNRFLDGLEEHKEEYTISEIIELTRGQYGSGTFEAFFKKEK